MSFDDNMATTSAAKVNTSISVSNTVTSTTSGLQEVGHAIVATGRRALRLPFTGKWPIILESPILLLFHFITHTFVFPALFPNN
ncbi:hypothetical protein SLU01_18810 [Sporosarcina luteola]|uniref:Uncharacterized protein n=1 Tax=Sporosarcina luteola TaxID=582850 RepID=A0A511Z800_9BACL|nr:hypothetical protein SLU01_18810 [Sporosarcina luteola]